VKWDCNFVVIGVGSLDVKVNHYICCLSESVCDYLNENVIELHIIEQCY
jgi:hypothetical protein